MKGWDRSVTQCLSVMRPRGSCCNCTQMYHPLPCREFHQKSQNLERYSVPSMVSLWAHPLSKGDIPEVWSSFAPEMGWGRRGPCAIPRELGRTVWSTRCSQSIPAPLSISNPSCPWAAATLWIWWPRIHPWPCHTEHPSSPLLLRNTNGHLFTPNWANLVFISHLGHRISKQIFLPQTDFLTLWFQSWFAVIFVWRDVLLSVKNERTRSYIGSCTWL